MLMGGTSLTSLFSSSPLFSYNNNNKKKNRRHQLIVHQRDNEIITSSSFDAPSLSFKANHSSIIIWICSNVIPTGFSKKITQFKTLDQMGPAEIAKEEYPPSVNENIKIIGLQLVRGKKGKE